MVAAAGAVVELAPSSAITHYLHPAKRASVASGGIL